MSRQKRFTRSILAMTSPMDGPERILHDANTNRSLVTVASEKTRARTDRGGASSELQLLAEALQALKDSDCRPQQESLKNDFGHGPIDMPSNDHYTQ